MKVYIKPWEEALKSAKEFGKRLVDTVGDRDYILSLSHRHGDWGHIVEAKKDISGKFVFYTTYEGMTVLDNCMGSGSTGVACVNTNRNFIGMELDENYFKIAKERIDKAISVR